MGGTMTGRMRPGRIFDATYLRRSESGRLDTPDARKIRFEEYNTRRTGFKVQRSRFKVRGRRHHADVL